MSQTPPEAYAEPVDTPPADLPPDYGPPPWWRNRLVLAVLLVLTVVVAAAVGLVLLAARAVRAARRRVTSEVVMYPVPDRSYAGTVYKIEFFDGDFPQLTDRPRSALVDLSAPDVDAQLDNLARLLADEVRHRDGQICERPRVVLRNALGKFVREWTVRA